jgi:hypothetical protein
MTLRAAADDESLRRSQSAPPASGPKRHGALRFSRLLAPEGVSKRHFSLVV